MSPTFYQFVHKQGWHQYYNYGSPIAMPQHVVYVYIDIGSAQDPTKEWMSNDDMLDWYASLLSAGCQFRVVDGFHRPLSVNYDEVVKRSMSSFQRNAVAAMNQQRQSTDQVTTAMAEDFSKKILAVR